MKNLRFVFIGLIGWYCLLITAHYFGQVPLWNDEQAVFNSVFLFKPSAFFSHPLLTAQEFPRLYLWGIQQFSRIFSYNLLALRFFSFVSMLTAFFVWLKVVRSQSQDSRSIVLFIGCWCASIPLVYHAAELKPYSTDVLVSGLFMLFLYRQPDLQKTPQLHRRLLFLMPLLGLISYPVMFLYPLPLWNLVSDANTRRRLSPELLCYLAGGLCWVSFVYFFDYRVTRMTFLETGWKSNFILFDSPHMFFRTLGEQCNNIISRWFAEKPQWIRSTSRFFVGSGALYMLINAWRIFKAEGSRFRSLVPAALVVFLLHLMMGCLHKYPFSIPRLSLFFAPFILWMTVLALQWLRGKNKLWGKVVEAAFAVYLLIVSLGIARVIFACDPALHQTGPGLAGESVLWK